MGEGRPVEIPAGAGPAVAALLAAAGYSPSFEVRPVPAGANNRVFRLDGEGYSVLLKVYFRHAGDERDRLGAEFSFLSFAWESGIRSVPRPIARDEEGLVGLYEFVHGRALEPREVTKEAVGRAIEFFSDLNHPGRAAAAERLPVASEACFSVARHLECVERRVRDLMGMGQAGAVDEEAREFARSGLARAWDRVQDEVTAAAQAGGVPLERELDARDRCVSPSDFGFHNALLQANGSLRFIDFEYAGWDDPAKTVCDFFCQPALPVPMDLFDGFTEAVASRFPDPDALRRRVVALLPVYRVKWSCILLNDFLPPGLARRRFSQPGGEENRKRAQLVKARAMLARAWERPAPASTLGESRKDPCKPLP